MNQDNIVQTPYGVFSGVTSVGYSEAGDIMELRLEEKNVIITHVGELIPYYGEDTPRRKYKASVTFHKNGMIKTVSLEAQQEIMTPIGDLPAELVTFYETGELKRVFPLDGKISGFWSEEDERGLNIPLSFEFYFSTFTAMLVGICFYKSGNIRSVTLFPKEVINIYTPETGEISTRNGFSIYESGRLQSVEPAVPTPVKTPIGVITAYDPEASGVSADSNSLRFNEDGEVIGIVTSGDRITVRSSDGSMRFFAPDEVENPNDENIKITVPLKISFEPMKRTVIITDAAGGKHGFSFDDSFIIHKGNLPDCKAQDCTNCSLCSH